MTKRLTRTTYKQFEEMLNFVKTNRIVLTGKTKPSENKRVVNLWSEFAIRVNSLGYGPQKTGEQWRHVFNEWKTNTRRKSREIVKEINGTGGGPPGIKKLTELEEQLLALIGKIHLGDVEICDSLGINKSKDAMVNASEGVETSFDLVETEPWNLLEFQEAGTSSDLSREEISVLQTEHDYYKGEDTRDTVETGLYDQFREIFNLNNNKYPTPSTSNIVNWTIFVFSIFTCLFCATVIYGQSSLFSDPYLVVGFSISIICMLLLFVILIRQPQADVKLSFKVPLVPFIPCISVLFNLYLMLQLDKNTWMRFAVWLIIGFLIYFFYGYSHSEENYNRKKKDLPVQSSPDKEVTKF